MKHATEQVDALWQKMKDKGLLDNRSVHFLETTESTNSVALELGRQGAADGTLVIAETQTKGRGRLSRKWVSPKGAGLYFSLILRPNLAPADFPKITLAAGVALCKALENVADVAPQIKWPNDILFDGKKCGGILAEAEGLLGNDEPFVVLGVGLNITTPLSAFPEDLRPRVTTLKDAAGQDVLRGELLKIILQQLDGVLERSWKGDFLRILDEWRGRDAVLGKKLSWVTLPGSIVTGISLGPDDQGILHIQDDRGTIHEVISGDVNWAVE